MKTYSLKFDVEGEGPVEIEVSKSTFDMIMSSIQKS